MIKKIFYSVLWSGMVDKMNEVIEKVNEIDERERVEPDRTVWCKEINNFIIDTDKCDKYKREESEIIGNIMWWQGKNYLRADFVPNWNNFDTACIKNAYWVPFSKIDITDSLARQRTDTQPIWVMVGSAGCKKLEKLIAVDKNTHCPYKTITKDNNTNGWPFCHLATVEDLRREGIC